MTTTMLLTDPSVNQSGGAEVQRSDPFLCNICKRTYSRIDHLARHYRSHTNEKPFSCHICKKDFARADLLKRHVAAHEDDKGSRKKQKTDHPPSTRPRVPQACSTCAKAKLKCEAKRPCHRCQDKGIECISPPRRPRRGTLASIDEVDTSQDQSSSNPNVIHSDWTTPPLQSGDIQHGTMQAEQPILIDPFPMPTPMTFPPVGGDSDPMDTLGGDPLGFFDDSSLADFLRDVMMADSPNAYSRDQGLDSTTEASPRDVLNFGVNSVFDLPELDTSIQIPHIESVLQPIQFSQTKLDYYLPNTQSGTRTPVGNTGISLGTQAFRDSLWKWTPVQQDHGRAEQLNLSLPSGEMNVGDGNILNDGLLKDIQVGQAARDRILAMILTTCEPNMFAKIVTSFPSAELLTSLLHNFIASHSAQTDSWIHYSTFQNANELRSELLAIMIAAGAVMSEIAVIRKLGFAIQEAVRLAIPQVFESDNRTTRDLQPLQAYAIQLDIGLWSGDRRKMEMAESFKQPAITMIRRAGYFRRAKRTPTAPRPEDTVESLETKWKNWIEAESFKRLAFHLMILDVQISVSLLIPPSISYTEMSAELPSCKDMWASNSSTEWKDKHTQNMTPLNERLPSLPTCIHDISALTKFKQAVDLKLAILIILHGIWTLIWDYRQLNMITKLNPSNGAWNSGLITTSLHSEVRQLLSHFHMVVSEWTDAMQPESTLVFEQSLMNLHVSFEDLQLFAGKEGEQEAKRIYPLLLQWVEGRESRQAIWHAGQVLRAAKQYRGKTFQDFSAISLYHASLALWAKAVVSSAPKKSSGTGNDKSQTQRIHDISNSLGNEQTDLIWLDGEDGSAVQRYLALGRGTPAIRRLEGMESSSHRPAYATLDDPRALMEIAIEILRVKSRGEGRSMLQSGTESNQTLTCPPLVENLSRLMDNLGKAAEGMKR